MKTVTWVLLATSLAIGWGCARSDWIERTLVTSDVTGVWEGVSMGIWTMKFKLVLQQQGAKVTGVMSGNWDAISPSRHIEGIAIEGRVNGDTFTFQEVGGGPTTRREYHVNGDVMTGGQGRTTRLHRQP